jgi:hypothetical protein
MPKNPKLRRYYRELLDDVGKQTDKSNTLAGIRTTDVLPIELPRFPDSPIAVAVNRAVFTSFWY